MKDDSLSIRDANQKLKDLVFSYGLSLSNRNLDGYANMLYQKSYAKESYSILLFLLHMQHVILVFLCYSDID